MNSKLQSKYSHSFILVFCFLCLTTFNSHLCDSYEQKPLSLETGKTSVTLTSQNDDGSGASLEKLAANFWSGSKGEEHITKLSSENFSKFISQHRDTFVMFYANWCSASQEASSEFATVAQEMAYTEGFTNIHFGALDCGGSEANKFICNKAYGIIKYPRFIYFKNGKYERQYTTWCPRHSDYFYSWLVYGGNEKYCSGTVSGGVNHLISSISIASSSNKQTVPMIYSTLIAFVLVILIILISI